MTKKKILFVTHGTSLYGSERSMLDIIDNIDRSCYEFTAIIRREGLFSEVLRERGVKTIIYPMEHWIAFDYEYSRRHFKKVFFELPKRVKFICRVIDEENIDLVYTNSMITIDGAVAARVKGIPNITHVVELLKDEPLFKPYFPRPVIHGIVRALSQAVITVTEGSRRQLLGAKNPERDRKVTVIFSGVNIAKYEEFKDQQKTDAFLKGECGIEEDVPVVSLLGRFVESKGQEDFLKAARIVCQKEKKVFFVIMGSGPKKKIQEYNDIIKEYHLEDHVKVLGFHADVVPVMKATSILVLASTIDPCPLIVFEGMAAGKPVIVTRSGGAAEVLEDGKSGIVIPPSSPQQMAEAILNLMQDPDLARKMGASGYARVKSQFSLERFGQSVQEVIDRVLDRS